MATDPDRLGLLLRLDPDKHHPSEWTTDGRPLTDEERTLLAACEPDDFHMAIELLEVNITKDSSDVVNLEYGRAVHRGLTTRRTNKLIIGGQDRATMDLLKVSPRIIALRKALEVMEPKHIGLLGRLIHGEQREQATHVRGTTP